MRRGTYMTVTGTLPRPGVVHVRLALPNGDYAVKTIDVT